MGMGLLSPIMELEFILANFTTVLSMEEVNWLTMFNNMNTKGLLTEIGCRDKVL